MYAQEHGHRIRCVVEGAEIDGLLQRLGC